MGWAYLWYWPWATSHTNRTKTAIPTNKQQRFMVSKLPMLLLLTTARRASTFVAPRTTAWRPAALTVRFMSTDAAAAEEKTEEEKAAIKAVREAKK
jgi:hypothetical protein